MNVIKTKHSLDFETAHSDFGTHFKIGTCTGLWGSVNGAYFILSVSNDEPGNGHLDDVFEWFEFSCKRDKRNLLILEIMNAPFYMHLISKRGFIPMDTGGSNVIKVFNKQAYDRMVQKGNEIIKAKTLTCI